MAERACFNRDRWSALLGKKHPGHSLEERLGFQRLYLDDFVLPTEAWPSLNSPAFPFEYIRYDDFLKAVTSLASNGQCTYPPFDWETLSLSEQPRTVALKNPLIIEGISSLNPLLCAFYQLKIFVESDPTTILSVALTRGNGLWADEWRNLFVPSAELYMKSHPASRADAIVAGRGIFSHIDKPA